MKRVMEKKRIIIFTIITLFLVGGTNAFASGIIQKKIEVIYNNIKLVVNGKPASFGKDLAGKQIEPFIHNGTTYLPVRAVGEALGENVEWDANTKTVYVGERPGKVKYLTETINPYAYEYTNIIKLNDPKKISMGGVDYTTGYELHSSGSYLMFNLNGKYKEITGMLGVSEINYSGRISNVNVYLDGKLYHTYNLDSNALPEKITIPVKNVMQLRIEVDNYTGNKVGFTNAIIK